MADPLCHQIRKAAPPDYQALSRIERRAFIELGSAFYPLEDIKCALDHFEGLSLSLIEEGHYFVLTDTEGNILAGGGWSRGELEYMPVEGGARGEDLTGVVRCVYVCPEHARRGLAQEVLRCIETDALAAGISQLTLTASKTAEALYARAGYALGPYCNVFLPNGHDLPLRQMRKNLVCQPA
ncbi:MAG: GNAT family N-acetyltransferase [Rhizobiaceae bacterium]